MPPLGNPSPHPFRRSDAPVKLIGIIAALAVIASAALSWFLAYGNGVATHTDSGVPTPAAVLANLAAVAIVPCLLLYGALLVTRLRALGFLLGWLIILSTLGMAASVIVDASSAHGTWDTGSMVTILLMVIPIALGVMVLRTAMGIPDIPRGRNVP